LPMFRATHSGPLLPEVTKVLPTEPITNAFSLTITTLPINQTETCSLNAPNDLSQAGAMDGLL